MKHPEDLTVVFTGPLLEANVLVEIFKKNSIPVVPHDHFNANLHAGFISGVAGDVELVVKNEDANRAKELIQAYERSIAQENTEENGYN